MRFWDVASGRQVRELAGHRFALVEVNPQPQTLNPQPQTLNPTPQTLHPKPCTRVLPESARGTGTS